MTSKVLNFKSGHIDNLPDWFQIPEMGLKVICGPGDYVHFDESLNRYVTNVEKYIDYDVFVCFGDEGDYQKEAYASVQENERYLIDHNYNKLICLIDIYDDAQMTNFKQLFGNQVIHINRQDHHCPIFKMDDSFELLKAGGIVHIKSPMGNIALPAAEKKARGMEMYKHYGFKCEFTDFTEPTTERVYKDTLVCTKRDYGNNLFGGKRRMKTKKRTARHLTARHLTARHLTARRAKATRHLTARRAKATRR
jgi:hypothetical protein